MYEKRKTYLSYWRVFSLAVIILFVLLFAVFPLFFNSSFGFIDFFSERFSAEKGVLFAPGDPCVNLNVGPFGPLPLSVNRIDRGGGIYDYYINDYVTLCTQTYSFNDANSPNNNGVIIINASNIVFDCNNSIIRNLTTSTSEWRGITATNIVNFTFNNCTIEGFGRGIYFFNVTNSTSENIKVLSSLDEGFEINQSSDNYFNKVNLSISSGTGIYFIQGSLRNIINNSFFNKVAENTVYSIGSSNRTTILNSVFYNCSYTDSGENGVIRELSSWGAIVDNVKIYYGIRGFVNDKQNSFCGGDIIKNFYMTDASDTGIQLRGDCHNVSIDNATILYSSRMGIEIKSDNNLVNNSFIAHTQGAGSPYGGITLRSGVFTFGNKIMNSLFLNNSVGGVVVYLNQTFIELFNVRAYNNTEYNLFITPYYQGGISVVNVTDSDFNDSLISSRDIYIYSRANDIVNLTLTNTSFYNFTVAQDGIKQINVRWWVDALARDSFSMPIQNVNVSARDRNNQFVFSVFTGSDGRIKKQSVLQSIHVGPASAIVNNYYSNYSFSSVHPNGIENLMQSWNMSTSRNLSFIFGSGSSSIFVNFTNPTPLNSSSQIKNFIYVNLSTQGSNNQYSFVDFDNSLVVWLRMDERVNPTIVRDLSGNGNNGTLMGGVVVNSSGRFGNGSWFDGTNDWIDLDERTFDYENRTVSVWFYSRDVSPNTEIFSSGSGLAGPNSKFYIEIFGSQLIVQVGNYGNYVFIPQTLNNNRWYHVAVSYANSTNGNVSIYLNGEIVDSHLTNLSGATGVNIGTYNDGNANFWRGGIDEFLIFNRSLSAVEIKSLYNASAYQYENNFTNLRMGVHNFKGYGVDYSGAMNFTENRQVTISSYSDVLFNWPTPLNWSINKLGYFNINASIIESNLTKVVFNWNSTNYSLYDDSVVLKMNFDNRSLLGENDLIVRDLSRYGRNGAVNGAVWNSSGRYGGTYDFNGSTRVSISSLTKANNTNYTYSLWLNWKQIKPYHFFMGQAQTNVGSFVIGNNQFGFRETSSPYYYYYFSSALPYFNQWVHLTYVFTDRNNNISLYINGAYNSSVSGLSSNAVSFTGIGDGYGLNNGLNGSIDELIIWNRSLSDDEIAKVYFTNLQKYSPELWYLSINQTKNLTSVLDEGNYSYLVSVKNGVGQEFSSETRHITIKYSPNILFSSPTPEDGAIIGRSFFVFNFSIIEDTNGLRTAGFNWNGINYTLLNDSLVLMYNFDNISVLGEDYSPCGTIKDLSKYGNNGRLSNASCSLDRTPVWNSTGKYGGAFEFNGNGLNIGQSILVLHNNSLNPGSGDFSLALWYKPRNNHDGDILRKGSGSTGANEFYNLEHSTGFLLNSNRFCFELDTTAGNYQIVTKNSYNDGKWHHIFAQRKGGVAEIWIDGLNQEIDYYRNDAGPVSPFSISGSISNMNNLTIGSKDSQLDDFMNGGLDELRIYRRSFNELEIKQLYYSNLNKYDNNRWGLTVNESLSYDSFNYSGYIQDNLGINVSTEFRRVNGFPEIYVELDSCQNLNLANGYYVMNSSIINHTFRGACINITANNVILDCRGFYIFSESNQTGIRSNATNTIIRNCNVSVGRGNTGIGIYLSSANNSIVSNITLRNNKEGIYLKNSHFANISFINSNNNSDGDIILENSNRNILSNLFLMNSLYGLTLYSSNLNAINLFNISRASDGVIMGLSNNNSFSNFSLDFNSNGGINLDSSNNNLFNSFNISSSLNGLFLQQSDSNIFNSFNIKNSLNNGIYVYFLSYYNNFSNFKINNISLNGLFVAGISNNFYNGFVNKTEGNAIYLSGAEADDNLFRNITLLNTNTSNYDLRLNNAGIDRTWLIDMPQIGNYSFSGAGGRVRFRNSLYGEINFLESISGSGNNLSNDVRIRYNSAIVESVLRPGLNKSANISLYGLADDFNPPAIFRDDNVCPNSLCYNFTSLNAGEVIFRVNSWTEYHISTDINANLPPILFFENPTPEYRARNSNHNILVNVSIIDLGGINGRRGIEQIIFNWNSTNYSLYDDSVVLKMNFDNRSLLGENDTHVKDLSRHGNNCTVVGAIFNGTGKYGGAYQFDGSGDYINISDSNGGKEFNFGKNIDKSYTISVWVYPRSLGEGGNARIYDKCLGGTVCSGGYVAYIRSGTMGRDLRVSNDGSSYLDVPGAFSSFYNWTHVLVTFNDSNKNLTVYINGRVNASRISVSPSSTTASLIIGNRNLLSDSRAFDGLIDEFTAWNRTLSVSEVKQIYDSNLNKYDFNRWGFFINESSITDGTYEYFGAARDLDNNWGLTEGRIITIGNDIIAPDINFTNPTPPNASIRRGLYVDINVSINEYGETGINEVNFSWDGVNYNIYNKDVILMMNFDNRSQLGENDSFVRDVSRYGNNGTVKGGARWSSNGKSGGAFYLDNVDDYIAVNPNSFPNQLNEYTIETWVNISSAGSDNSGMIYSRNIPSGNSVIMYFGHRNTYGNLVGLSLAHNGVATHDIYMANIGEWYHLVTRYNGTRLSLFVNGAEVWSILANPIGTSSTCPLLIGVDADSGCEGSLSDDFLNGLIDEFSVWNKSLSNEDITQLYFSELYMYRQNSWNLIIRQGKNATLGLVDMKNYSYFASVNDIVGNYNRTETRTLISNLAIADIDNLRYLNINPGRMLRVNFSVYILAGINSDIGRVNVSFSNGSISRNNPSCQYVGITGGNLFNYSCSGDIWYFDSPGEWTINAYLYDNSLSFHDSYNETFVLMYESSIQHTGALNWGGVVGGTNASVLFLLNNTGNTPFNSFYLNAKNLLIGGIGPEFISANQFYISDILNPGICTGYNMEEGNLVFLDGITLAVGNNSINSFNDLSGQKRLYACLEVPSDSANLPKGNYMAAGSNSWELTSSPEHDFFS